jgi:hypothetical protein
MSKKYYILQEQLNKVKSGPHAPVEIAEMYAAKLIRKSTPIRDSKGKLYNPEMVISEELNKIKHVLLTPRQRGYLRYLGYNGTLFMSQDKCSEIIEKLRYNSNNQAQSFDECVKDAEKDTPEYWYQALKKYSKKPLGCIGCLFYLLLIIVVFYILAWLGTKP